MGGDRDQALTSTKFVASYVSKQTDLNNTVAFGGKAQNADPVQAAVMSEIV